MQTYTVTVEDNGTTIRWRNELGQRHRLDGPAIIHANGDCEWYVNGSLHRLDGPAIVRADGTVEYWVNDRLHRLDGPAIERADGTVEYWVNDTEMSKDKFKKHALLKNSL
jgi:hypothetical protein